MHSVEINGKPVPISYELKNGDVVSILTGEGNPSPEWMRFAKSRSTRSKLRQYFRSKQRDSVHTHSVYAAHVNNNNTAWSDEEAWDELGSSDSFILAEIVVMAHDRKLLLADCSVIASKNSEILKTGSSSNQEHCILEFLVRVTDFNEVQTLMDKLRDVDSVLSVERRVR